MDYKNGEAVIPTSLLKELQKYVQGELIYIPKSNEKRAGWGQLNGTRSAMDTRNNEIFRAFKNGRKISDLSEEYYLSEDSIKKIISKVKSKNN